MDYSIPILNAMLAFLAEQKTVLTKLWGSNITAFFALYIPFRELLDDYFNDSEYKSSQRMEGVTSG